MEEDPVRPDPPPCNAPSFSNLAKFSSLSSRTPDKVQNEGVLHGGGSTVPDPPPYENLAKFPKLSLLLHIYAAVRK